MRVLVACEFSGIVRDAFIALGHDAVSCDLLETERKGPHFKGDIFELLIDDTFDLMVAFPPCTHLAISGARWFKQKQIEQVEAIEFFIRLALQPIARIAIENPIGIMSTHYRKPDQIIQPWQFGHGETKATCLWLKNLPPLKSTKIVLGRNPRVHHEPPSQNRWEE